MTMDKKILSRYCIYEKGKGYLSIKLQVSDDIVAGIDFKLYKPDSDIHFKQWKMGAKNSTPQELRIPVDTIILNKCVLTWQILSCSKVLKNEIGTVQFEISQQDKNCKITIPTLWQFTDLPPCAVKAYSKVTESLLFILKT